MSFFISKLMKSLSRSSPGGDVRHPITFSALKQLVGCLHKICHNTDEALLFSTAVSVAFFVLFCFLESVIYQVPDVCLNKPRAYILLRGSKSDQKGC